MRRFVLSCLWLALACLTAGAAIGETIVIQSSVALPPQFAHSFDVRWAKGESFTLALGKGGVVECALTNLNQCSLVISPIGAHAATVATPEQVPGFFFSSRLAASDSYLVAASPFRGFAYRPIAGKGLTQAGFETIVDIDAHKSNVAILGARRDQSGAWAPEGAIVWLGSLDFKLRDLRPIHYSATGGGARTMALCSIFDDGTVRFLKNGNLFVVPGVESGAFLYDRNGRLVRTWPTEHLGILDSCTTSQSLSDTLAKDFALRADWLNKYRVIDDAVELDDGPGVIVRTSSAAGTKWRILQFRYDGTNRDIPLAVSSPSPYAHLNVDRRGSKLIFLLRDSEIRGRTGIGARLVTGVVKP
jgi:hypothetical protein